MTMDKKKLQTAQAEAHLNFHKKFAFITPELKPRQILAIYEVLDDAVSLGSAIASGHDVELADDGVRVIVEGK